VDALGSVSEVQTRVREIFESKIDLSEIERIEPNDRVAKTLRNSSFDWREFERRGD